MMHLKNKFVFDIKLIHKFWNKKYLSFANVYCLFSFINNLNLLLRLKLIKQNEFNVNVGAMVKTNCTNCFWNMQCRLHIAVGLLFTMQFYSYELHYKFNGKFYQPTVSKYVVDWIFFNVMKNARLSLLWWKFAFATIMIQVYTF